MGLSTSSTAQPIAGSAASLRQRNSQAVLETLYRHGQSASAATPSLRVVELMRSTGLSRPTVETVAEGLTAQGWLTLGEPAEGGGRLGRPAKTYSFHARAGHVVGVDVGAHAVAVCVADLLGTRVALAREVVSPSTSAPRRLAALRRTLRGALETAGLRPSDPLALTAGTPGILDPSRRRILTSPGLAGWAEFDLLSALEDLVGCDVELENDANLAAVAERSVQHGDQHGEARPDPDDLIFLLLGERLGAGVIVNGQLVRGHHGASGELWNVRSGVRETAGDQRRPLGSIVNAPSLAHAAEQSPRPPAGRAGRGGERGGAEGAAPRTVDQIARELAHGISPVLLTLDLETVVLGGDLGEAGPALRQALAGELEDLVLYPPRVELSRLGVDAILAGAVLQSRAKVEREVLAQVVA
ncbi:ROK family protein [Kineococcus aurantiacus]|uniref:Putative NBD/HSP70 family sugar kinase n=1 Tax=Kineococcus aurantiacus TaxID=37633 RepID=A0A7Y9DQS4_9ACTN|nr:putative NBD/HSP70 family sugar kinase [Kineococcus aurantiacus]